jgi:hypothetical protein
MATLEELVIELKLDSADMKRNLAKVQGDLQKTSKVASNVGATFSKVGGMIAGAFAVGKITGDIKTAINYMDDMAKAADKVGISSEAFSKLAYAAKLTGVPLGAVELALRKMQLSLVEAGGNSGSKAAKALEVLELKAEDLRAVGADEAFASIADGLRKIEDPALKAAAAQAIFGRGAIQLNDILKEGGDAIRAYGEEAEKAGLVITKEMADKAEEAKKSFDRLSGAYQGFMVALADSGAIDTVTRLLISMGAAILDISGYFRDASKEKANFDAVMSKLPSDFARSEYKQKTEDIEKYSGELVKLNQDIAYYQKLQKDGAQTSGGLLDLYRADSAEKTIKDLKERRQEIAKLLGTSIDTRGQLTGGIKVEKPVIEEPKKNTGFSSLDDKDTGKADKEAEKAQDEALRFYEQSKSDVEKIQSTIEEINKLHAEGAFAQEAHYEKAIEYQEKLLQDAERATDTLQNDIRAAGNSITDGIGAELVDAMKRGESAGKALWDSFKYRALNAIGDVAGKMVGRLFSGGEGGSGGGLGDFLVDGAGDLFKGDFFGDIFKNFPSFDNGGFTGNGNGAGMDGKGGFPAMLHPNEMVLNQGQLKNMGKGSGTILNQNINLIATSASEIDRRVQQQIPTIVRLTANAVKGEMSRGGDMSKQVGRRL